MPTRLTLAVLLGLAAPAAGHEPDFTVAAFFELPELFQIATLSGAVAVLLHAPAAEPGDAACFARWETHEDVLAVFSAYTRKHGYTLPEPFAPTLVEALRDRCRRT